MLVPLGWYPGCLTPLLEPFKRGYIWIYPINTHDINLYKVYMRLIFKGTIPRLTTMNEEGVLHCLGLRFVGHLDSLNYHVLFFLLGTMSRINGETSGFHSESFRRSIPSIGSCRVWNTNPTNNVPFVGFPVTIYFPMFLSLILLSHSCSTSFGKESRFMQILYLVMTYTHKS